MGDTNIWNDCQVDSSPGSICHPGNRNGHSRPQPQSSKTTFKQQLVLATMVDSLLSSDINLIGLSVMDVLLGLIQHVLRVLQLSSAAPHPQRETGAAGIAWPPESTLLLPWQVPQVETSKVATDVRKDFAI